MFVKIVILLKINSITINQLKAGLLPALLLSYALISTSTPEGKSSLLSASTVLEEDV